MTAHMVARKPACNVGSWHEPEGSERTNLIPVTEVKQAPMLQWRAR
jgi:hypothetical protein